MNIISYHGAFCYITTQLISCGLVTILLSYLMYSFFVSSATSGIYYRSVQEPALRWAGVPRVMVFSFGKCPGGSPGLLRSAPPQAGGGWRRRCPGSFPNGKIMPRFVLFAMLIRFNNMYELLDIININRRYFNNYLKLIQYVDK